MRCIASLSSIACIAIIGTLGSGSACSGSVAGLDGAWISVGGALGLNAALPIIIACFYGAWVAVVWTLGRSMAHSSLTFILFSAWIAVVTRYAIGPSCTVTAGYMGVTKASEEVAVLRAGNAVGSAFGSPLAGAILTLVPFSAWIAVVT